MIKHDLHISQGGTFKKTLQCSGEDFTGYTARMQARVHPSKNEILFEIVPELDSDGKISIEIPAETTNEFTWTKGVYDIEITSPEGEVSFPYFGVISVRLRITR